MLSRRPVPRSHVAIAASGCGGDSEAEFRAAFKKKFGEAPWYHHITGIEVNDKAGNVTAVNVTTDLGPESAWDGKGEWSGTSGVICRSATPNAGAMAGAAATKSAIVWPGRIRTVKTTGGPRSTWPMIGTTRDGPLGV